MLNDAGGPCWSYESRAGLGTALDLRTKKKRDAECQKSSCTVRLRRGGVSHSGLAPKWKSLHRRVK
eukprot:3044127-Prymnesium_polylepis.1